VCPKKKGKSRNRKSLVKKGKVGERVNPLEKESEGEYTKEGKVGRKSLKGAQERQVTHRVEPRKGWATRSRGGQKNIRQGTKKKGGKWSLPAPTKLPGDQNTTTSSFESHKPLTTNVVLGPANGRGQPVGEKGRGQERP